ncbi:RfbD dTDP-4-dehydrorhamnose reductase [Microbacteriaceae bacterium]
MGYALLGSSGMLGADISAALADLISSVRSIDRRELEAAASIDVITSKLAGSDSLVNATGFTAVDRAESEQDQANLVNAVYPAKLALAAKDLGFRFIHISTDYVFDGTSTLPYKITDTPNPQSVYGQSKLAGEIAVQESGADYQIFRTAWLYGANGNCFPKTVARVLKQAGQMKVVNDQVGQPTWTKDLAELIIAHQNLEASVHPRIVHATASGSCSWYEFACEIAASLGYIPDQVIIPITTAEYPTPAKRPAYSVLDNQNETGLVIGDWRNRWKEAAPLVLAEYL